MLTDQKILVTGPAGQIAKPMVRYLAQNNEVWGIARFSDPASRAEVEAMGARTIKADLGAGELDELPTDFTYVLHLAAAQDTDGNYDKAITVNAEGTGLLMHHCRTAKAVLVMSTHSVYKPQPDPRHVFKTSDPLGDVNAAHSPAYSMSKIGQEAVARTCARLFDLPTIIGRMNASYGPNGGLPAYQCDAVADGRPVVTRWDPCPYQPIHEDDINDQLEGLLDAAGVPAPIVNFAGDEAVTVQQWTALAGEVLGVEATVNVVEMPGTLRGSCADVAKRIAFAGPCKVDWRDGIRDMVNKRADGSGMRR